MTLSRVRVAGGHSTDLGLSVFFVFFFGSILLDAESVSFDFCT